MTIPDLSTSCLTFGLFVAVIGLGALWWDLKGRSDDDGED